MRFWYKLQCRAAKAQANLRKCADSPGYLFLALTNLNIHKDMDHNFGL